MRTYNAEYVNRKYSSDSYLPVVDDEDDEYLQAAVEAFEVDTGVDFKLMLDFLAFLKMDVCHTDFSWEVRPNVYIVGADALIDNYIAAFETPYPRDAIDKIVQFLTVMPSFLKTLKGKSEDILPVWDREYRDMRFEVRPLLICEGKVIFSPVTANDLYDKWKLALPNWYPPYEIGLPRFMETLKKWKERHEKLMVVQLGKMYERIEGITYYCDLKLHSRFKNEGYPSALGDYDVLAIDSNRRVVWIIEAKVLSKAGSTFEVQKQQNNFFYEDKYDEKFQRRRLFGQK